MVRRARRRARGFADLPQYPWYDQQWLHAYVNSRAYLAKRHPEVLGEFEEALSVFRTDPSFAPVLLDDFYDASTLDRIKAAIDSYDPGQLERHELEAFGRDVVHDHPVFVELQHDAVDAMSEAVGERVEACYNFLSLYKSDGVCAVHMDAPDAKWTLDICIDQSRPWPIHFSDVVPWPEDWHGPSDQDWESAIKAQHRFESHAMTPGQAIAFAGSSQWHYRDPMEQATDEDFCTLLFFHFVPAGCGDLVHPRTWPERFGVPALAEVVRRR